MFFCAGDSNKWAMYAGVGVHRDVRGATVQLERALERSQDASEAFAPLMALIGLRCSHFVENVVASAREASTRAYRVYRFFKRPEEPWKAMRRKDPPAPARDAEKARLKEANARALNERDRKATRRSDPRRLQPVFRSTEDAVLVVLCACVVLLLYTRFVVMRRYETLASRGARREDAGWIGAQILYAGAGLACAVAILIGITVYDFAVSVF